MKQSERSKRYEEKLKLFMKECIYPAEPVYKAQLDAAESRWAEPPIMKSLQAEARKRGLWNLFLPVEMKAFGAPGLRNAEYAPLCEIMGRSPLAPLACNCNAPDTGNMEVLLHYGTPAQQKQWLEPLLRGEIRSGFAMTEPAVASSDATNISIEMRVEGEEIVISGRKWWTSGAGHEDCKILIVMGKTDPGAQKHKQQTMVLVPMDSEGVKVIRPLHVFGYDDAPHGHMEIEFNAVRVPTSNVLLGMGRGFEIAQGRLGPGRIHHTMRAIGCAERVLASTVERAKNRIVFGEVLAKYSTIQATIGRHRIAIEQCRLLVLHTAHLIDEKGAKKARDYIAMIKVSVPRLTCEIVDEAIQIFGGAGICDDYGLAYAYASLRTLRIADGPDDVHLRTIARFEFQHGAL